MDGRFERIAAVFDGALALPPHERDAYLVRACGGDAGIEADVRALLAHHDRSESFLEPGGAEARALEAEAGALAAAGDAPTAGPLPDVHAAGARFGSWRIVRPIGEGGMGTVHLAERTTEGFTQRGALKVLRPGAFSTEMVRRFVRERRILARLEHPGIARLLDGGTTAAGLPWLVMEYVEGQPLYEYCSERRLPVAERLHLFLRTCSAVQYAHQQLVLHRDIKPGNLLVTADGTPRLLDFGIAKIFDDDAPVDVTRTHFAPMTPEYASPEQLRGEPVGTASDVYALGVMLYELLTGARPYPNTTSAHEYSRYVLEQEPARPSTMLRAAPPDAGATTSGRMRLPLPPRGEAGALKRRLAGDLDNIVMKALQKDSARRYASVEHFTDDLKRHLKGLPVSARPDAWSYRASKFVRRHRVPLAAGTVAVLALLVGAGIATWQAGVARREAALAERRFRDVHELAHSLLFDVHDAIKDLPGAVPARETILAKATLYLARLRADAGRDTALQVELGRAYLRLGEIQGEPDHANSGHAEDALRSFTAARDLLAGVEAGRPNDVPVVFGLMDACNRITLYDLQHERAVEALAMQERAVSLNQRLVQLAPDSLTFRIGLPRRRHNLALALHAAGRDAEALTMVRAGLDGFADLVRRNPGDPKHAAALAKALTGYADILRESHASTDSAEAAARRSMTLQEPLMAAAPGDADLERRYAANLVILAGCVGNDRTRPDSAVVLMRRANALLAACAAGDPGNADYALSLLIGQVGEGVFLALGGWDAAANARLVPALRRLEKLRDADTTDTRVSSQIIEAHDALARAAIAHARRTAHGRPGPAWEWRAASAHLDAAAALLSRTAAQGDAWAKQRLKDAPAAGLRAACDSALAVPAGGRGATAAAAR